MTARHNFLDEEVCELFNAMLDQDLPGVIDALVDIVVVAKGTAVMMGIEWKPHWDEVKRANMQKVRGHHEKRPDMPTDLVKPEGWCGPNHQKILDRHSW